MQGDMWFAELKWGMIDTLVLSKEHVGKQIPITKELVYHLQEELFKKIYTNTKEDNFTFDELTKGTMVLSFYIDYKELSQTIKNNSLKLYNNISDEEFNIRSKFDDMSVTSDEAQLLQRFKKGRLSKEGFKQQAKKLEKQIKIDKKNGIHRQTLEDYMKRNNRK